MNRILLILLLVCQAIYAQKQDSIQLKYAATIRASDLKMHLEELASDTYEGRETGTQGQKLAAEYISNYFRSIDIAAPQALGGYYQKFPLIEQEKEGVTIHIDGKEMEWIKEFAAFSGLLKNGNYNAEIVFAGYGVADEKYDDYQDLDVRNKVVLVLRGTPNEIGDDVWHFYKKLEVAAEKGAKSLLVIDTDFEEKKDRLEKRSKHKIVKLADEKAYLKIPAFFINGTRGEDLLGMSIKKAEKLLGKKNRKKHGLLQKNIEIKIDRKTGIISSENVLGYLKGDSLPEEIVVVTAHYDHLGVRDGEIYNGADDDGSGTVALLELAEAFIKARKDSVPLIRSLLFMTVAGEEKGLLGSKYYTNNPVLSLDNTVTDLNIDMIGRFDKKHKSAKSYIYVIGADRLSKELHDINENANATYTSLDLDYTYNDEKDPNRYYYRSDHYNFAKKEIPIIFYFSGVHEDYHKPTDTIDKIDFELLEKRSRLIFHTAWELVNREKRIVLNE